MIRSYDEHAFDMSEESEKEKFIVKKSLRPVPSRGMVEQAKNMVASDPNEVTQDMPEVPREWGGWGSPDKGHNLIMPLIIFKRGVLINPNTQF